MMRSDLESKQKVCSIEGPMEDVTVILTVWKRDHFEEQMQALLTQTRLPKHIWIYHCCNYVSMEKKLETYPFSHYFASTVNLKYHGRFSLASHVNTKFTWILDDDVIPSKNWLETSIGICDKYNAICCSSGRIIPVHNYFPEFPVDKHYLQKYFIGDNDDASGTNSCSKDTVVDFGCNSWFFYTEWIRHFWSVWPLTFETGEDIHFSAACKMGAGISTVIPQQNSTDVCGNLKKQYGFDAAASWRDPAFIHKRKQILEYLISVKGWNPSQWI